MKYLSHLRELRSRLLYSFIFLIICFFFFLYKASIIGEFLSQPLFDLLKDDEDKRMIFTALPEVFLSNLKISLFASFIFALPFLLIQLILFISPAMYKKEKKTLFPILVAIPVLFIIGVMFAYYILLPLIWNFFLSFENFFSNGLNVELESRYSEYMRLTMMLLLSAGLSFEFPVVLIILTKFKILSIKTLKNNRKYFFIGILIFSAIFTPPDIISQLGIAIPLIIFYEFSIIFINFFLKK
ncbi:MAG: twin-arginine translocase subunit TatC [Rickettsiales bacterium]|nr:twin-arginine translocase subunit TatC [Rickettsiales bacterium]